MMRDAKFPGTGPVVPSVPTTAVAPMPAWVPFAALLACAILVGCIGTSPPARFYLLTSRVEPGGHLEHRNAAATPGPVQAEEAGIFLLVGPVEVASYLDRPQIVTRSGEDEVKLAEFDRWAQPLRESLGKVCAESLSILLGRERVIAGEEPLWGGAKYRVTVSVLRFDGEVGGEVVLDAQWILLQNSPPNVVSARRTRVVKSAGSDGYRSLVAAMSESVGVLCSEIAAAVKEARLL